MRFGTSGAKEVAAVLLTVFVLDILNGGVSSVSARKTDPEQISVPNQGIKEDARPHSRLGLTYLDKAIKALRSNDYEGALAAYGQILDDAEKFNDIDIAVAYKMRGMANVAMEDYKAASEDLGLAIVHPSLAAEDVSELQLVVARVTFLQGRIGDTINLLNEWFADAESPAADVFFFAAQAHVELGRWSEAEGFVEQGLAKMDPDTAEESFYAIAVAVYVQQQKFDDALPLLRIMESRWPKG